MTLSCDVAITRGGIGGLTLASSLAQRPISAMVFEYRSRCESRNGEGPAQVAGGFGGVVPPGQVEGSDGEATWPSPSCG
jgi:2-polyprenyl-6-methoxyphenol hydroxylase-like FAD-dependent oxidoreductase